jgi:hypothetical protein
LPIPVFCYLICGPKKPFLTGFLRISFFSCVFWRNFSQEHGFGGVAGIPIFFLLLQDFFAGIPAGQEFLNLLQIPPESEGFLQIPVPANCCLARPATKEGSLLSKIWTKIDLFQPLSWTGGLDHGFRCPLPLLAPRGLKVRAAAAAEAVMAEEAALMVKAMADVVLEMTIATADADNIRQQTTINNRRGAQLCLAVATTEV